MFGPSLDTGIWYNVAVTNVGSGVTLYLNGVKLYDHQEVKPMKGAAGRLGEAPTGPLYLQEHGIGCSIHYKTPIHLQPACRHYGYPRGSFPVTEAACEQILSLPMYPELTTEQIQTVIDGVKQAVIH